MIIPYFKLVRDRIPEIIRQKGKKPVSRKLSAEEFRQELYKKLEEEILELKKTDDKNGMEYEMADIYEVLDAIISEMGLDKSAITAKQSSKKSERGAFRDRIYLECVEEKS